MLVLGIESATPLASVALTDEKGLLGEILLNVGLTHSEQLLPMIDSLLRQCRRTVRDITAIGVSAGPGSFTGLRIGMATAKALAQGLSAAPGAARDAASRETPDTANDAAAYGTPGAPNDTAMREISGVANGVAPRGRIPVVAVPTLEAMTWQMAGQPVLVSPMLNARREQVYAGLYRWRAVKAGANIGTGTNTDMGTGATTGADNGKGTDANTGSDAGIGAEVETRRQSLREVFAGRQRGKKERMDAGMDVTTGEGARTWKRDCLIAPVAVSPEAWAAQIADCLAGHSVTYTDGHAGKYVDGDTVGTVVNGTVAWDTVGAVTGDAAAYPTDYAPGPRRALPLYLLGDGAAMYREIWARDVAESVILPPIAGLCRGSFVALAAMDTLRGGEAAAQETQEFYGMKPIYLRGI